MTNPKKPLIISAFDMGASGHQAPGLWKHPKDKSAVKDLEYWINLAKLLEDGKFNSLFLADVLAGYDVYMGPRNLGPSQISGAQWPVIDPTIVVPAMAAATKNLGFGITYSTISEAPYLLTRKLSTFDFLTKGRIGWNVVTSYLDSAARNTLDGKGLPSHDERYVRAEEYIDVVYKLSLSSWSDDAVQLDREQGVFTDPSKVREINHQGKYFTVPGPNIVQPTPQRLPVILQAGTSAAGKNFAAKNAEVVFISVYTPEKLGQEIASVKKIAKETYGREEGSIKFLQLVTTIIGDTHEEAEAKYKEYKSYGDREGAQALFGGWTGIDLAKYSEDEELVHVESNAVRGFAESWTKVAPGDDPKTKKTREFIADQLTVGGVGPVFWGTADEVADQIEHWVNISKVDGFNFAYAITPGSFEDIVYKLIPILRKRGLAWNDYPKEGLTYREQFFGTEREEANFLLPSHPAHKLRWKAGVTKEEFEELLKY